MKKIASIAVLMMTAFVAQAQKVTFYSLEFENGIRNYIGLGETDDVLQFQMDTITTLDLSGLGITDIRDAIYLTAVSKLDLSYNNITDISSLLPLASLHELNLSNNQLENIDILAFTQSEQMEVDVTNNYISDFSIFYASSPCDFTFMGMSLQLEKNVPYFDVYQFYADINRSGHPVISYRGYTNTAAAINMPGVQEPILLDGDTHQKEMPGGVTETVEAILTNGEKSVNTYVVPYASLSVDAGQTVMLSTGLPDDYILTSAYASKGTVNIVGNTIAYTAPDTKIPDILHFAYYQGSTLKGFSRYYINSIQGDANSDGSVTIRDAVAIVNYILGNPPDDFNFDAAGINNDGEITIADAVGVVNIISNRSGASAPKMDIKETEVVLE